MTQPLVVVNFKTYATASGEASQALLAAMERHANGPANFVATVSAFDLSACSNDATAVHVWSQHLD